ncbi:MAG: AAA family ATPase [Anaerococcus vaginalis]|uniref:McrB family protein n=1 Tax=Anaerococcus vaginalis TaxID=33037 RepID=UPI0029060351|nr:AAA family ATPase [Anaerococcus vaginalis]MDU5086900.1 AAA family ATPase [Anaerococcus vaginalis]
MTTINIDYKGVLDYLDNNQEVPYSNPEEAGVDQVEKDRLLKVKEKGQAAVAEMKKMAARCEQLFGLDKCLPISWLDGSNTKTRKYLWAQIKYKDYTANPASISLFVEKNNGMTRYRISLEIKNDGANKKTMASYHSHLDIPKEDGMVYVSGSNEWGNPAIITDSVDQIKAKIDSGEIRKVQLCVYVESVEEKTNEQYDADVMAAVKKIIPYYEHVIGKSSTPSTGRAWLLTWNHANWDWANYKAWCKDTKLGNKFIEPWACASKQPVVGDEIFLIKTGSKPRGILAHGYVAKGAYEADHYDPEKAAAGVKANHIDAEYDWIQDYDTEPLLMQDDLKIKFPDQQWSPMGSGIEIKSSVLPELKKMWLELIGKKAEDVIYWPSLEEYDPGITKEKWMELLKDPNVTNEDNLRMFKMIIELGGESTCINLSEIYGGSDVSYNNWGRNFGERVHRKTNCPLLSDGDRHHYYAIPYVGRYIIEKDKTRYSWKLRSELEEALKEMDLSHIDLTSEEESVIAYDKNMILYGPPGTGKTYSAAIYAVAICDQLALDIVKAMDYGEVMLRYRELLATGRVAFTTFHQSYGYEEFIEGIKPVLDDGSDIGYTIEDGVFKKFCDDARIPENNDIQCFGDLWIIRNRAGDSDVPFDYEDYLLKNGVIMVETNDEYDKSHCNMISKMKKGDWVVLGRGYKIAALGVIDDEEVSEIDCEPFHWKREVNWLVTGLSATFSDIGIVGGCFSNYAIAKSKYKVQNFYKLINAENKKAKPHVFVIDEINRGNISKILGELITLIEDTKRESMDEQVAAVLPYSGESFSVPSNVYILGTMNTADRSIALMDTALRRRFQFVEMMPDADVLRDIGADKVDDLDVAAMLEKINERITFLYDREHTIGHAFFTKLAKAPTIETLKVIFEKSVIPLLQEYFYEDYQKIQLVLGDNGKTDPSIKFILDEEVKVKNIFKGNADDVIDLPDKKYTINTEAFENLESYKQII